MDSFSLDCFSSWSFLGKMSSASMALTFRVRMSNFGSSSRIDAAERVRSSLVSTWFFWIPKITLFWAAILRSFDYSSTEALRCSIIESFVDLSGLLNLEDLEDVSLSSNLGFYETEGLVLLDTIFLIFSGICLGFSCVTVLAFSGTYDLGF